MPNIQDETYFYDEPAREKVYEWAERRRVKNRRGIFNRFRLFLIDSETIKHLFGNFNILMAINLLVTAVSTYLCLRYNIEYSTYVTSFIQIISLATSFLIDAQFTRRENALYLLADLRAYCISTFLMCKAWKEKLNVSDDDYYYLFNLFIRLLIHVNEYLQSISVEKQKYIQNIIYEDISDITSCIKKFGIDKEGISVDIRTPVLAWVSNRLGNLYEHLTVYRQYKSPITEISFAKILGWLYPILFSPWYAYLTYGNKSGSRYLAIFYNCFLTFIFGETLVILDNLFDPFRSITCDDINMGEINNWINNAFIRTAYRKYVSREKSDNIPCGKAVYVKKQEVIPVELVQKHISELPVKIKMRISGIKGEKIQIFIQKTAPEDRESITEL